VASGVHKDQVVHIKIKCPQTPKKAKYFKSRIAKWKSSKSLKYSCSRHSDSEEEEFVMLIQAIIGNNMNVILLKLEQVETLVIELTKVEETFSDKVTDEDDEFLIIDEWDLNSPSSKYRRCMVDVFFSIDEIKCIIYINMKNRKEL